MADIATWLNLSTLAGRGDGSVNVSAVENTGRSEREQTLVWYNKEGLVTSVNRKVKQLGRDEFVEIPDSEYSISQLGGVLSIIGTSNSKKLSFSINSGNSIGITTPGSYFISNKEITNGQGHPDDPGNTQQYEFRITFTIPPNEGFEDKIATLTVKCNDESVSDSCTIKSSKSSPALSVTPEEIILSASGKAEEGQYFDVKSNIEWSIRGQ